MNKYIIADSYVTYTQVGEPFEKSGRKYIKVQCKCDRCGGDGIYKWGVVNGVPSHIGLCYKCNGTGIVTDEVRIYTEKEKAQADKAKERAAARKEEQRQKYLAAAKDKWLEKNGFNEDGTTQMAIGDTYSIKDDLKSAGFKFNSTLGWHAPKADRFECITVKFDDIYSWDYEAGKPFVKEGMDEKLKGLRQPKIESNSQFVGEIKERLYNMEVTFVGFHQVDTRYGLTNLFKFEDADGNIFTWWTGTEHDIQIGDKVDLTGTVKDHTSFNGEKQTVLTRCKVVVG